MGNRGELKVENKQLIGLSRWKTQTWIYCSIDPKYRPKEGEKPLKYTKLFFMDEYTALAAGHRPCGYCLRNRFHEFIDAWLAGNPEYGYGNNDLKKIDKVLHEERKNSNRGKQTYPEKLVNLPDGVMVSLDVTTGESYLLQGGKLRIWAPTGYAAPIYIDPGIEVQVLTPKSIVNAIRVGLLDPINK
jgi:hypothetical protein